MTDTEDRKKTCVRDSVAHVLRLRADDVPDFVHGNSDNDEFNARWPWDLAEWAKTRGFHALFINMKVEGNSAVSPLLEILRVLGEPVIGLTLSPGSDIGHAIVMKIGPTHDEASSYIVFDPGNPQCDPGSLVCGPGTKITGYIAFHPMPKSVHWWGNLALLVGMIRYSLCNLGSSTTNTLINCFLWLQKHWAVLPEDVKAIVHWKIKTAMEKSL